MPIKRVLKGSKKADAERDERSDYESHGTAMILRAIETAANAGRQMAESVKAELEDHTKHDDDRFERLTRLVESIAIDVKSLIETRTFGQAVWWTVTKAGSVIVLMIGGLWALYTYITGRP